MRMLEKSQNSTLKFRKIMGRTYLHENRLEDAVDIFIGILRDDPDDVETLMELGDLCLAHAEHHPELLRIHDNLQVSMALKKAQAAQSAGRESHPDLPSEKGASPVTTIRTIVQLLPDLEQIPAAHWIDGGRAQKSWNSSDSSRRIST
jgi:hypothetical protein